VTAQKPDPTGAKILDGAIRVLGDFGFKRATVELVAKYAGVSHMTIYRRWPSKVDLLKTAIVGEFTRLLDTAFQQAAGHDTAFADRTLHAFTDVVWAVQGHPLATRELNTESSESSPMMSSTAAAVMEASVPLVADQLRRAGTTTDDTPADLEPVADVFVRLAYSLVTVKRPERPLTTRAEVADYANECFGPYLKGLNPQAELLVVDDTADDDTIDDAAVVDLEKHRASRARPQRLYLQIAAASIFGVLTLGAGLAAVLGGTVKLPFITPAGISKPTNTVPPTGIPVGPRPVLELQVPAPPLQPDSPALLFPPAAADPSLPRPTVPQIEAVQRPAPAGGLVGSNPAAGGAPVPDNPVPVLAPPPPKPSPGPQPGPGPTPPGPGPGPGPQPGPGPGPGPKPPGPGPKPPGPGPNQQGPNQGPNQQGPNQGPNQQGPNQQGPNQQGSGKQGNQQSGPSQ
jgi:AcrR family transcriptional regulator